MTTRARAVSVVAICAIRLAIPADLTARGQGEVIELRVMTYASDPSDVQRAGQVALDVLGAADLHALWRICAAGPGGCAPSPDATRSVLVRLLPLSRVSDRSVGGETVKDQVTGGPAILVYLGSEQALTRSFQQMAEGRSNPALASLSWGDLAGLTIAHEIGHVLGLSHSKTGLMKPRWDTADIIAAHDSRLVFQRKESVAMAIAMRSDNVTLALAR
jgi:hypothetical protein